jgi:hypothetical protein
LNASPCFLIGGKIFPDPVTAEATKISGVNESGGNRLRLQADPPGGRGQLL